MPDDLTVPKAFAATVARQPNDVALRWREGDDVREWTWQEYADLVAKAAGAFSRLGVQRGDRAVLMLRNVPEFHVADMALAYLGVCSISIYNSSAPEQVEYLAHHSEAKVALVEDIGFLERFLKVRSALPALQHVAVVRDPDGLAPEEVHHWDELLGGEPADLAAIVDTAQPSDLCTVIYTSGTTGPPKGVMIDHENVSWTSACLLDAMKSGGAGDVRGWRQVSYLPMAHIAERMTGHYNHIRAGTVVTCCPDTAEIASYIREVHPNLLFGVPRIWEKIHAGVMAMLSKEPDEAKRAAAAQGLEVGRRHAELSVSGDPIPDDLAAAHAQADAQLLSLARGLIGLDEIAVAITGAAPISEDVLWFFRGIGVNLSEIYGMSESTGPISWDPYEVRIGTVGRALPGVEVTLAEDGEVLFRGGNSFKGYLKDPEKTAETIDAEGWVHTGDIGAFDDDGYLRIVDRKKELIITAGGKNISPANIETLLKSTPLIAQACVIGDRRKFMSALIVLDPDVAPAWAKANGVDVATFADLATNDVVRAEVQRGVDEANGQLNNVEQIKKFTILPAEWMPDSEELTPTMKLKRRGVNAKYSAEIEAMYA
jgi:long-chain acyl-CoA synthetase